MATTESSSTELQSAKKHQPQDLPEWQHDEFSRMMQQWQAAINEAALKDNDTSPAMPDTVKCFTQEPKAAFHFHSLTTLIMKWHGDSSPEPFDSLSWIRKEEPQIVLNLKSLMSSREQDFQNGKFPSRTCMMEIKNLNRAVYGVNHFNPDSEVPMPNSIMNHLSALDACLQHDIHSRWWELCRDVCYHLCSMFQDTSEGLEALVARHEEGGLPNAIETTSDGRTDTEQTGLRRRRPDIATKPSKSEGEAQSLYQNPGDHTPLEATVLLARALDAAFRKIPFSELRDALWKDDRAPVSMSLVFTSISSVLIGVALASHNRYRCYSRSMIDDGFFALLSNTMIQLFSLYVLLLPFLRGQESHLRGVWFCLSIALSVILSVVACIVYAFSWHASTILSFGGTVASMIVTLLLVQSIDKGSTAKESGTANGDV